MLLLATGCNSTKNINAPTGFTASKAMVVSAREEASKIGVEILKKGGNAFDAMVATELALAVAYPYAGNIGGGGFMVYRKANGEAGSLDYREMAPSAATVDMYLDKDGNVIPNKSTSTALAVGVPGTIAGVFAVHRKLCTMPIRELIQPAIDLAKKGVVVTKKQELQQKANIEAIVAANGTRSLFGRQFNENDTIKYPALAATLTRIAENGEDEFYKGSTGKKLIAYLTSKGGIITMQDLASYKAKWREPIKFNYKDLSIISMSPPSSGGICLGQIMTMIEPYDLKKSGHNSAEYIQILTEAERRAYADRNYFLGDPDFVNIPVSQLLDKKYLKNRMVDFDISHATKSSDVSPGKVAFTEQMETTHYSIVDQWGNAVSATTTLNGAFGSKLYCDEVGFFLNNEMDDFSAKPGVANMFGLIGAKANSIAPGKRMLSSMTPTIVLRDGKLFMVLGSPGGSTIITSVLQVLLNVSEFGMSMQEAVDAPRFHHQWLPDEIMFEPEKFPSEVLQTLERRKYNLNQKSAPVIGKVDAVLVQPNKLLEAGADSRGDDKAAGF